MRRRVFSVGCVCSVFYAAGAASAGVVASGFESGLDGWTSFQNGAFAPEWVAPMGMDGGYARLTDSTDEWGYFRAPITYTAPGIQLGGAFAFDLRHEVDGAPVQYNVRVGITGGGLTIINESARPTTEWGRYTFDLDVGNGWRVFSNLSQNYSSSAPLATLAQLEQVFGNATGLFIAADYTPTFAPEDIDRTFIDNVELSVVPAPGAGAILAFAGVLLNRRRR